MSSSSSSVSPSPSPSTSLSVPPVNPTASSSSSSSSSSSTSLSRLSRFRSRKPMDLLKSIRVVNTQIDRDEELEELLLSSASNAASNSISSVMIPVPPVNYDEKYFERFSYSPFSAVDHYIKTFQCTSAIPIPQMEQYDLLHDDMEWMNQYNGANGYTLNNQTNQWILTNNSNPLVSGKSSVPSPSSSSSPPPPLLPDDMERLIDLFEKCSGKKTLRGDLLTLDEKIDPSRLFSLVDAIMISKELKCGTHVESVYNYWIGKRRRMQKALMRVFQEPPPKGNTDPHVAFRPRSEGRRISKRNPRKEDSSSWHKMAALKKDFLTTIEIFDLMEQREQLKRQGALMDYQIFDEKLYNSPAVQRMLREQLIATEKETGKATNIRDLINKHQITCHLTHKTQFQQPPNKVTPPPLPTLISMLKSVLPPATFTKENSERENAKKKSKRQQNPNTQSGKGMASGLSSTSSASKSHHSHSSSHLSHSKEKSKSNNNPNKSNLPNNHSHSSSHKKNPNQNNPNHQSHNGTNVSNSNGNDNSQSMVVDSDSESFEGEGDDSMPLLRHSHSSHSTNGNGDGDDISNYSNSNGSELDENENDYLEEIELFIKRKKITMTKSANIHNISTYIHDALHGVHGAFAPSPSPLHWIPPIDGRLVVRPPPGIPDAIRGRVRPIAQRNGRISFQKFNYFNFENQTNESEREISRNYQKHQGHMGHFDNQIQWMGIQWEKEKENHVEQQGNHEGEREGEGDGEQHHEDGEEHKHWRGKGKGKGKGNGNGHGKDKDKGNISQSPPPSTSPLLFVDFPMDLGSENAETMANFNIKMDTY